MQYRENCNNPYVHEKIPKTWGLSVTNGHIHGERSRKQRFFAPDNSLKGRVCNNSIISLWLEARLEHTINDIMKLFEVAFVTMVLAGDEHKIKLVMKVKVIISLFI